LKIAFFNQPWSDALSPELLSWEEISDSLLRLYKNICASNR